MKRKFIAILLLLTLVLSTFPSTAFAASNPSVSAESCKAKPGGAAGLSVNIADNPGLISFILFVECDTSVFNLDYDETNECYEIEAGEAFSSMLCNTQGSTGWKIVWYGSNEVTSDGTLFTLPFHVSENAAAGSYEVKLTYSEKNTLNGAYQKVSLNCTNGSIEVLPKTADFSVRNENCVPSGNLDLSVDFDANPGIASYMIYVDCDTDVFSVPYNEETKSYEVRLGDFASGGTIVCNKNGSRGYKVVWMNTTESWDTGTAFTLPLMVSQTAEPKDYPITLRIEPASVCDAKGNAVSTEIHSGTISVTPVSIGAVTCVYSQSAKRLTASVPVQNGTDENVTVICAAYVKGQMLGVHTASAAAFGVDALESSFSNINADLSDLSVKVFVLSSGTYSPVIEAQTPTIEKAD